MSDTAGSSFESIVIKGSRFFYNTTGNQFIIKGVSYFPPAGGDDIFADVIADDAACLRDVSILQELKINLVHIRYVDPLKSHSKCMSIFRDAGIYVLVDLDLNRDIYTDSSRWDINIYTWTTTVVDQLASFPNILGFIVAQVYHERLNAPPSSVAFVKAAARDIKYYIRSQNYRQIPVGVRGRNSDNYDAAATYLTCGNSTAETIDFWSLWDFSWCGDGDDSDYETVTSSHQKYNIPSFIYYGCNSIRPRNFTEVGAIYGTQMLAVWSGGIVQKWLEDYEDLGLIELNESGNIDLANSNDYQPFSRALAAVSPSSTQMSAYTPTNSPLRICPTVDDKWPVSTILPPQPNSELCACMKSSLSCVFKSETFPTDVRLNFTNEICTHNSTACLGRAAHPTTGQYGAFSVCSLEDQASWSLNIFTVHQVSIGNSSGCNIGEYIKEQTPSVGDACGSLLAEAGPLGDKTLVVKALPSATVAISEPTSSVTGSGTSSEPNDQNSGGGNARLSAGAISGIAIGVLVVCAALVGLILFCWKRRARVVTMDDSSQGLEVGKAPPGYEHVRNVELGDNTPKSELPAENKVLELPAAVPVPKVSGAGNGESKPLKGPNVTKLDAGDQQADRPAPGVQTNLSPITAAERTSVVGAISTESTQQHFSPSWSDGAWFDPSDSRQVLSEASPSSSKRAER